MPQKVVRMPRLRRTVKVLLAQLRYATVPPLSPFWRHIYKDTESLKSQYEDAALH